MKRLEEIESRENKREQRNNVLLKNLEDSISNFDTATEKTEKRFKNAALHYVERIDTDNLEQDFQQALDTKFKQVNNKADELFNYYEITNKQVQEKMDKHQKTIDNRLNNNDKLIHTYNKTLKQMTNGIFALFFVILIVSLTSLLTGPVGHLLQIDNLFNTVSQQITQGESIWRYLFYLVYLIPYVLLSLILCLCIWFLRVFDDKLN
ncbi:DUF334 domain-containing protein [Staphylococcus pseudoxylosus]|uniref:DUF334 domain-containing protein n=1 Tax=Staphylococcus pseudoxylosus TaxID=2282419 RepID=UPI002DBD7EF1|nr:DUF334 domain-containing protein [Staphylococcus pseudoxylosus]MEB6038128.1 DUF334 domain-containing protein [Staphylococcus pseudoxylosus]MEB7765381.1 DUF334 domain-containing protein [Staphylococcus pseudoxylosus]MEB8086028.1 DUF334 domain-containing protein [Staphylococcus pseudoxylosus]